jgi:hypothetical protein
VTGDPALVFSLPRQDVSEPIRINRGSAGDGGRDACKSIRPRFTSGKNKTRQPMFWKFSSLLIFAFACSTVGGSQTNTRAGNAEKQHSSTCKTSSANAHVTNAEVYAAESGTPVSPGYGDRVDGTRAPTGHEIDAAETGNPHAVDNANRSDGDHSPSNDEIGAEETGNPHSVDNAKRASGTTDRNGSSADCNDPESPVPQAN